MECSIAGVGERKIVGDDLAGFDPAEVESRLSELDLRSAVTWFRGGQPDARRGGRVGAGSCGQPDIRPGRGRLRLRGNHRRRGCLEHGQLDEWESWIVGFYARFDCLAGFFLEPGRKTQGEVELAAGLKLFDFDVPPSASRAGSIKTSRLVLLFWMVATNCTGFASGPGGRVSWEGVTVTAGCTVANAATFITGIFAYEVLRVICADGLGELRGGRPSSGVRIPFPPSRS